MTETNFQHQKKYFTLIFLLIVILLLLIGEFFILRTFFDIIPKGAQPADEPLNINTATVDALLASTQPSIDCVAYFSTDTDEDGVVDNLEKKYGTNAEKKDSDEDGLTDGDEIKKGENPNGKKATIITKNTDIPQDFATYTNDAYNYSIHIPKSWVSEVSEDNKQVNFYLSQEILEKGENPVFRIFVYDNKKNLTLEQLLISWYVEAETITPLKFGNQPAQKLEGSDLHKLVIPNNNTVFALTAFEDETLFNTVASSLLMEQKP